MIKYFLVFVCMNFGISALISQYIPLLENDKHWVFQSIQLSDSNSAATHGFLVNIQGDTIINGHTYQKLYKHNLLGEHNCSNPPCFSPYYPYEIEKPILYALLREDTQEGIVYSYGFNYSNYYDCLEETELFNFSLMQGDSLDHCVRSWLGESWLGGEGQGIGVIDSITSEMIFNEQRRIIHTQGDAQFNGLQFADLITITEGIGYDLYGFFPGTQDALSDFCIGTLSECNIISSAKNDSQFAQIKVYPNPVIDKLFLESDLDISRVRISNEFSQPVYDGAETIIDVNHFLTGTYFVNIHHGNQQITNLKFIKME